MKIISGGQTGVDRTALDVALKHGIECGGWCPAGRLDEFGRIPDLYPVKELEQGSFAERTMQNVKDSEGTVIIYFDRLRGGTEFTLECCKQLQRPHKLIDGAKTSAENAAQLIVDFVRGNKIDILNIAGPRKSEWAGGYDYAAHALEVFVTKIKTKSKRKSRVTRSAGLLPGRDARRSKRGSKRRANKSKKR